MSAEQFWPAASVAVAILALIVSTVLLARQTRQIEHERNALAILEAIRRITDPDLDEIFRRLERINERYPTDDDVREKLPGSADDRDLFLAGTYVETIAVLARRGALDASLLVDAVGLTLRRRWEYIRDLVERERRVRENPYILENFEWLAMYSAWWKDVPRNPRDRNYAPDQFRNVEFRI